MKAGVVVAGWSRAVPHSPQNAKDRPFAFYVIGAVTPGVASVRVSLGDSVWAGARIVTLQPVLDFPTGFG